jgi:hypothetical protein
MAKVYRKSHDAIGKLKVIGSALDRLIELTAEGEGPLEYCGWRHAVHDEAKILAVSFGRLIVEAANDEASI